MYGISKQKRAILYLLPDEMKGAVAWASVMGLVDYIPVTVTT